MIQITMAHVALRINTNLVMIDTSSDHYGVQLITPDNLPNTSSEDIERVEHFSGGESQSDDESGTSARQTRLWDNTEKVLLLNVCEDVALTKQSHNSVWKLISQRMEVLGVKVSNTQCKKQVVILLFT